MSCSLQSNESADSTEKVELADEVEVVESSQGTLLSIISGWGGWFGKPAELMKLGLVSACTVDLVVLVDHLILRISSHSLVHNLQP